MFPDLSGLLKAVSGSPQRTHSIRNSAVFSIPDATERSKRIEARYIDTTPYKILDAPGLIDDYYLNLLDWTENRISIALRDTVYTYDVDTRDVSEVYTCPGGYVSSIRGSGGKLVIGESTGRVIVHDVARGTTSGTFSNHSTRVCSIALSERITSTGDKAGRIANVDVRVPGAASVLVGHTQEVCGLRWNNEYLASGSNDNSVRVWKAGSPLSRVLTGHGSAVKALDWCPWKTDILATGGGTRDKTIRFWDTQTGRCIKSVGVESQVCSLTYLSRYKELVSSHGFHENDLRIWKVAGMRAISSFGAHESRVLHTALSPDQCSIVSLGADESLKFWKIAQRNDRVMKRDSIGLR